jgi:hypothetical protein
MPAAAGQLERGVSRLVPERKDRRMFIRNDMHRKELGAHFWDAADDFSGWEWLLFMKGA